MKKELGILLIFVALLAGAMLLSGCGKKTIEEEITMPPITPPVNQQENEKTLPVISKPWVQISKGSLFLIVPATSTTGTVQIALKTGDELNEGDQIETDKTGLANIYFPDGSVARLDTETRITITSALYVPNSKTLVVRLKLSAGSIWSKIMKLATPESVWEVNSTNAVAAVRGSAFGMSVRGGKIRVIGSEHKIIVDLFDAKTGFLIKGQEAFVAENDYLDITPEELAAFIKGEKKVSDDVEKIPAGVLEESWVKFSLAADKKINDRLLEFETQGLSNDQALDKYRASVIEEFYPLVTAEQKSADMEVGVSAVTTTPNQPTSTIIDGTTTTTPNQSTSTVTGVTTTTEPFNPNGTTTTPVTGGR
jgi:FecR protein